MVGYQDYYGYIINLSKQVNQSFHNYYIYLMVKNRYNRINTFIYYMYPEEVNELVNKVKQYKHKHQLVHVYSQIKSREPNMRAIKIDTNLKGMPNKHLTEVNGVRCVGLDAWWD